MTPFRFGPPPAPPPNATPYERQLASYVARLVSEVEAFSARLGILALQQGTGFTPAPNTTYLNNVDEVTEHMTGPSKLALIEGSAASPDNTNVNPVLWIQKYARKSQGSAAAQTVGGAFVDLEIGGSGSFTAKSLGTWIGALSSASGNGAWNSSTGSPLYDTDGDVVGLAGFARNQAVPTNGHIITALWGYAEGPTVDATTYGNLPADNWSIAGGEINLKINHPDLGAKTSLSGKGSSVGWLLSNYRVTGGGVMDWTFGEVLTGTPNDGDFTSTDVTNWSGFYTGYLIDKIKTRGILFGNLFANNSYGIQFPTSYPATGRPLAAVLVGDNALNLNTAYSATPANGDFYSDGSFLKYKIAGTACRLLMSNANVVTLPGSTTWSINGGFNFVMSTVVNAVNYTTLFNAATGNSPAIVATGSDTDVGLELRCKGAGDLLLTIPTGSLKFGTHTGSADAPVSGYITIKDSGGTTRKLAVIT